MCPKTGEVYPEWLQDIKAKLGQFVLDMIGARFMQEYDESTEVATVAPRSEPDRDAMTK